MRTFNTFRTLWNGGLDPVTADPKQLGERRIFSAIAFVLIPTSILLIVPNAFLFDGNVTRILIISGVMLGAMLGLYLQAYKGKQKFAAISVIGALWIAPISLMLDEGFSSSNWAWLLPVILLANFILSRAASIIYTVLSVLVLIVMAVLTFQGRVGQVIEIQEHAATVAISGSMIFILACMLGYAYRTSQLKSEEQLRANMRALADEVETRRTAEMKAQAGERAKATFLTTVSHELRTPLNGVIGASQLLAGKTLDKDQAELVEIIDNSAEILLEVINNVLDLSRLEEGRLDLRKAPMNLRAVLESGYGPLVVLCRERQLNLDLHIAEDVPEYVISDAARIRQIILNLVGNAIKFTKRGGIDLIVSLEADKIKIVVADTGVGIPEDKLQEIFNPFVQAESDVDRRFGGSGLGLSIVQRLVNLFEGSIEVDSELGVGTRFNLLLPMQPCLAPGAEAGSAQLQAAAGHSEEKHAVNYAGNKVEKYAENNVEHHHVVTQPASVSVTPAPEELPAQVNGLNEGLEKALPVYTVLVTDDNVVNRKVANKLLQELGCEVIEAADGIEALESVSKGNVDVILMDVQMPNMDGLTATSEIRKMNRPLCDTPIIGLSANAMPGDENKMLDAGMDCYLSKPVRLEKLRKALSVTTHETN